MRRLFVILALTVGVVACVAQSYRPVLADGREWVYAAIGYQADTLAYYKMSVDNDTIVADSQCKKVIICKIGDEQPVQVGYAREEAGKVFGYVAGEFLLLFDMNWSKGDDAGVGYVVAEDTALVDGDACKMLVIDSGADCDEYATLYSVIEGVGVSYDFGQSFLLDASVMYCALVSCADNGRIIYGQALPFGAIREITDDTASAPQFYDLSGRRVSATTPGGLYIDASRSRLIRL
jgi:hypothetical protein